MKKTVEEAAKVMQPFEKQVTEILYKNSSDDSECMRINFGTVPKIIDAIVKAGAEWAASLPTNSMQWVENLIDGYKKKAHYIDLELQGNGLTYMERKQREYILDCYTVFIRELQKPLPSAPTEPNGQ